MVEWKKFWKKTWHLIWEDNSIWSWIVNIVLAFVLIKFIVYPGLGFLLATTHPVVAVVSVSMEHKSSQSCVETKGFDLLGINLQNCNRYSYNLCGKNYASEIFFKLDDYWKVCGSWYELNTGIAKNDFLQFSLKNGFNKGDIMILKGRKPKDIKIGDVIVFWSAKKDPIIHRVVKKWQEKSLFYFQTKGDHNPYSIRIPSLDETMISEEQIVGNAVIRIPMLGYIKIWFVEIVRLMRAI